MSGLCGSIGAGPFGPMARLLQSRPVNPPTLSSPGSMEGHLTWAAKRLLQRERARGSKEGAAIPMEGRSRVHLGPPGPSTALSPPRIYLPSHRHVISSMQLASGGGSRQEESALWSGSGSSERPCAGNRRGLSGPAKRRAPESSRDLAADTASHLWIFEG
jgi:hypothetical protein